MCGPGDDNGVGGHSAHSIKGQHSRTFILDACTSTTCCWDDAMYGPPPSMCIKQQECSYPPSPLRNHSLV